VINIPQGSTSIRFVCQFNIEGRVKQVNAQLLADTIYCHEFDFHYVTNQTNITVPFAVIWDQHKALDNPDNIHGECHSTFAIYIASLGSFYSPLPQLIYCPLTHCFFVFLSCIVQ